MACLHTRHNELVSVGEGDEEGEEGDEGEEEGDR